MDPTTEATQTGEGAEAQTPAEGAQVQSEYSGPFAAALEAVPNGVDAVREALSNIEAKTSQRFQEYAGFRKTWEPYADLAEQIQPYGPEGLSQLLAMGNMLENPQLASEVVSDPETFRELWEGWGQALGYTEAEKQAAAGEQPGGEDLPPWAQEIKQQHQELAAWKQQQEQAKQTEAQESQQKEADAAFEQAMQSLATGEHKDLFQRGEDDKPTPVEQGVAGHAALLISSGMPIAEAVNKGMELVQQIRGQGQADLVREKLKGPEPAVKGGAADTRPRKPKTFDEVEARVDARMGAA